VEAASAFVLLKLVCVCVRVLPKVEQVKELPRLVIVGQDGVVALEDGIKKLRQNSAQFPFCPAAPDNVVLVEVGY
jgi:hypothetical protein